MISQTTSFAIHAHMFSWSTVFVEMPSCRPCVFVGLHRWFSWTPTSGETSVSCTRLCGFSSMRAHVSQDQSAVSDLLWCACRWCSPPSQCSDCVCALVFITPAWNTLSWQATGVNVSASTYCTPGVLDLNESLCVSRIYSFFVSAAHAHSLKHRHIYLRTLTREA